MKYRILVAVASLVLAALIIMLLPSPHPSVDTTLPTNGPTATHGSAGPTVKPPSTGTLPENAGVVRLYSCDEDFLPVFADLAAEYTALTGVEVVVLSPEADGCQATLQRYMESEDPPTVLCVHSQSQLKAWSNTLLDLEDTALAAALCNDGLGLRLDGKLLGIPAAVEGYGLLANSEVLSTVLSRSDIMDFSALSMWVNILKDNSIKAFPTATFSLQDAWILLMGEDLQSARAFIDLYLANGSTTGDPMTLFLDGKSAFYLGGTGDYDALAASTGTALSVGNLDILPTYSAGALQYICDTAWCVNASARQEDIDATLAFLTWMVTAPEGGAAPVDRLETLAPFTDAAWYGNWLENKLRGYMRTEAAVIQWDGGDLRTGRLLIALEAYLGESTDENWQQLCLTVEAIRAEYAYPY